MLRFRPLKLPGQRSIFSRSHQICHKSTDSKIPLPDHFYEMNERSQQHLERFIAAKEKEALKDLRKLSLKARKSLDDLKAIIERLENTRIDKDVNTPGDSKRRTQDKEKSKAR